MIVKGKIVCSALLFCAIFGISTQFHPMLHRQEPPSTKDEIALIHHLSDLWFKVMSFPDDAEHSKEILRLLKEKRYQAILGGWSVSGITVKDGATFIHMSPSSNKQEKTFTDYINCPPAMTLGFCPAQYFYDGEPLASVDADIWQKTKHSSSQKSIFFIHNDVIVSDRKDIDLLTFIKKSLF